MYTRFQSSIVKHTIVDYTLVKMVKRKSTIAFNEYPGIGGIYQTGYGPVKFNVYRTYNPNRQRGHGFGGLMRGLFRRAVPLLKKGLAHAGRRALRVGSDVLEDVLVNKTPLKQALNKRARSEVNELGNVLKNKLIGRGRPKGSKIAKKSINRRLLKGRSFINRPILQRGGRRQQNIETL